MTELSLTDAKRYLQWDRDQLVARIAALEADRDRLQAIVDGIAECWLGSFGNGHAYYRDHIAPAQTRKARDALGGWKP